MIRPPGSFPTWQQLGPEQADFSPSSWRSTQKSLLIEKDGAKEAGGLRTSAQDSFEVPDVKITAFCVTLLPLGQK